MGKKIASLYAEIGGDNTKLKGALKESKAGLSGLQSNIKAALVTVSALSGAMFVAGRFINQTAGAAVSYSNQVQDMGRITGDTAENTSRLIQVADDLRITYDELRTAMVMAARKGNATTIEGLKEMSDAYLALQPGVERTKYLLDNFGRSGARLGFLMEQGSNGIQDMANGVQDGLVINDAAIKKTEEYRLALDEFDDTVTATKQSIGLKLLPALTGLIDPMGTLNRKTMDLSGSYDEYSRLIDEAVQASGGYINTSVKMTEQQYTATKAAKDYVEVLADEVDATAELAEKQAILEVAHAKYLAGQEQTQTSITNVTQVMNTAKQSLADLAQQWVDDRFVEGGKKWIEMTGLLDEANNTNNLAMYENQKAYEDLLKAKDEHKITDEEFIERSRELAKERAVELALNINVQGNEELATAIELWGGILGMAPGAIKTLTFKINGGGLNLGMLSDIATNAPIDTWARPRKHEAGGARDYMVPPGFTGDSYPVMAQTGEHVTVEPVGERGRYGSGGSLTNYGHITVVSNPSSTIDLLQSLQGAMA